MNDLGAGFKVAKWRVFCHSAWSQISPARFKQVYYDSAIRTIPIKEQFNWHQCYMSALAFKGKMVFGDG